MPWQKLYIFDNYFIYLLFKAITEVVKDELYFELHNPFSKFWSQIDLEMAIKIFNKHGSIHGPIMREGLAKKFTCVLYFRFTNNIYESSHGFM